MPDLTMPEFLFDGPADSATTVALAHGAGAAMDTPFMNGIATRLAAERIRVARFEFPYMAKRRIDGKKRGPDSPGVLLDTWRSVRDTLSGPGRLYLAGKSMGGRYASLFVAQEARSNPDDTAISGVIALGYPFHPPGKPERLRVDHLTQLPVPMLVVQGERDTFVTSEEVDSYGLPGSIGLIWAPDGDHSLKPRKKSGYTEEENLDLAARGIVDFIART